jgi:hypothetical protein
MQSGVLSRWTQVESTGGSLICFSPKLFLVEGPGCCNKFKGVYLFYSIFVNKLVFPWCKIHDAVTNCNGVYEFYFIFAYKFFFPLCILASYLTLLIEI